MADNPLIDAPYMIAKKNAISRSNTGLNAFDAQGNPLVDEGHQGQVPQTYNPITGDPNQTQVSEDGLVRPAKLATLNSAATTTVGLQGQARAPIQNIDPAMRAPAAAPVSAVPAGTPPAQVAQTLLNNAEAMFGGSAYWAQMGQQSQQYLSQLMTGQTAATRALQSQEAGALADGIRNIFQNISSSAAANGISGGELVRLQSGAMINVAHAMGDFAMDNLKRMADTQAEGFDGLMKSWGLSQDAIAQWKDVYQTYKTIENNDAQLLDTFLAYASDDPILGSIYATAYDAIKAGKPLSEVLTPDQISRLRTLSAQNQTLADVAAQVAQIKDMGFEPVVVQALNPDGSLMVKADGSPVWEVKIGSTLTQDPVTDEWKMTLTPVTPANPDVPTPPDPLTPLKGRVPTDAEMPAIISDMSVTNWDRMTDAQQTAINIYLDGQFNATPNSAITYKKLGGIDKVWLRTPDDTPGYVTGAYTIGPGTSVYYKVYDADGRQIGALQVEKWRSEDSSTRSWNTISGAAWHGSQQ